MSPHPWLVTTALPGYMYQAADTLLVFVLLEKNCVYQSRQVLPSWKIHSGTGEDFMWLQTTKLNLYVFYRFKHKTPSYLLALFVCVSDYLVFVSKDVRHSIHATHTKQCFRNTAQHWCPVCTLQGCCLLGQRQTTGCKRNKLKCGKKFKHSLWHLKFL